MHLTVVFVFGIDLPSRTLSVSIVRNIEFCVYMHTLMITYKDFPLHK